MNIAIGADHRGQEAAEHLADKLRAAGHEVDVVGDLHSQSTDYPEPAYEVGSRVADGRARFGVLICGTGIGVSIAANKVKGVRAAVVHDELTATLSRSHNDANVVCMSADMLGERRMDAIVEAFIKSEFEGGRHSRRVGKIESIERGEDPAKATPVV